MVVKTNYLIEDSNWSNIINKKTINEYITGIFTNIVSILDYKISSKKTIEISITFTNNKNIQKLNKKYRECNKPTNVLSFPIYEKEFLSALKLENYLTIGDIVLSFETIKKESEEQNITFKNHLTHLIVHSILHLFGYDHVNDKDAEKMENLEIIILEKIGIANPYM